MGGEVVYTGQLQLPFSTAYTQCLIGIKYAPHLHVGFICWHGRGAAGCQASPNCPVWGPTHRIWASLAKCPFPWLPYFLKYTSPYSRRTINVIAPVNDWHCRLATSCIVCMLREKKNFNKARWLKLTKFCQPRNLCFRSMKKTGIFFFFLQFMFFF